jgi:hypothetical protein
MAWSATQWCSIRQPAPASLEPLGWEDENRPWRQWSKATWRDKPTSVNFRNFQPPALLKKSHLRFILAMVTDQTIESYERTEFFEIIRKEKSGHGGWKPPPLMKLIPIACLWILES